jgi:hypothetical protein
MGKPRAGKRARKVLPPTNGRPVNKRNVLHLDGMDAPNHGLCFDLQETPGEEVPYAPRFPLMQLMQAKDGAGQPSGLAFVDEVYGCKNWHDRLAEAPPTWMDPEIFARIVITDDTCRELYEKYAAKPTPANLRAVRAHIEGLFEEIYLWYIRERFGEIAGLFTSWVIAYHATQDSTPARWPNNRDQSRRKADEH